AAGEYCEKALAGSGASGQGGAGGSTCAPSSSGGKCLPLPPVCPGGQEPGPGPLTCLQACEVKPATKPFEVELKYAWGGQTEAPFASDVMMTPIVIQLDDDDCDGKITARDIPEILFTTFASDTGSYTGVGILHAISIVGGQVVEKWSVPGVVAAAAELAAGNIDGVPGNEVVACGHDGFMYAFRGDDTQLWKSAEAVPCRIPSIADLDQDGQPEVIEYTKILDGKDGSTRLSYSSGGYVSASDLDGDGKLDLVSSSRASRGDGTALATSTVTGSWNAIGDLDNDGRPEVIAANPGTHRLGVWHLDAAGQAVTVRAGVDLNAPFNPEGCGPLLPNHPEGYPGGGPPTIADFNGDGVPDVALAGGIGYAIFDGKKLMDPAVADADVFLWSKTTQDCSSAATGSSIFDFNGDGKAEVLYSDEVRFRVYDGPTGDVLFETCNTTGTLIEYPIVADVDGDDQADIIVASNAYAFTCDGTKQSGIRVFGSKNKDWVRTRRVWNQHAYHVTNVEEDGTIPAVEPTNWTQPGLNNFRQNKQPGLEFAAPDLVVSLGPSCGSPYGLAVTVRNVGQAAVPSGVGVGVYAGQPGQSALITTLTTSKTLYPAEAETFLVPAGSAEGVESGDVPVYAVADDGGAPHTWVECRTDNNRSAVVSGSCKP
ncbi:MAG: VCBS repeat-containing protein, partial [Myxococcales bacterium]